MNDMIVKAAKLEVSRRLAKKKLEKLKNMKEEIHRIKLNILQGEEEVSHIGKGNKHKGPL